MPEVSACDVMTHPYPTLTDRKDESLSVKKTVNIFRENVAALLKDRGEDGASLAFWCRHDKSWMSKILTGERVVKLGDIDAIADFFGLSPFQLFQPGISPLTERRVSQRRTGEERRKESRYPDAGPSQAFRRQRPQEAHTRRLLGEGKEPKR